MRNVAILLPLFLFMALMLAIGFWVRASAGKGFVEKYFIGGRNLGGFVLAMTTVATYSSVSSFVGGPGMAWQVGFGWVYMAVVQVTAIFLVLGVFGKRVALLARKFQAVTVVDLIRARFGSDLLAYLSAFILVLFFLGTMTAQFVGGAKLFEAVTGQSYFAGLVLFGVIVVLYTAVGGFRAVALTDTLCALFMMAGIALLFYFVLQAGGGYTNIMTNLHAQHPEMFTPLSAGKMPIGLYFTQWLLVGICTIALPQSIVRGISYKDTKGLRRAMLIGTFVIGFMNIGVNFTGILAHGVLNEPLKAYGTVDSIIPQTLAHAVPTELLGLAILGPIAASISTISGLLIVAASAVIKDVYLDIQRKKGITPSHRKVRLLSMTATTILGLLVFFLAISPPSLIWLINMFAFGGLETAFFWVMLFGLYWRKANKAAAFWSMAGGTCVYCLLMALGIKPFGLHAIAAGIPVSLLFFLFGAYIGKPTEAERLAQFFPSSKL